VSLDVMSVIWLTKLYRHGDRRPSCRGVDERCGFHRELVELALRHPECDDRSIAVRRTAV
jgi:hypothetical protein